MGTSKGLLPFKNKFWIQEQVARFQKITNTDIYIVFGHHANLYQETLGAWLHPFKVLINPHPEKGSFSSLMIALREIQKSNYEGAFVCPIDVPLPQKDVFASLAQAVLKNKTTLVAIPQFQTDQLHKKGHPVFLHHKFIQKLIAVDLDSPEARLDVQIKKLAPSSVELVDVFDSQIIENINTPENYQKYLSNIFQFVPKNEQKNLS